MLDEALKRARQLVEELEKQKAEIDASPPPKDLSAEDYAEGKHAMIKAVASARRMLVALEAAKQIADEEPDSTEDSEQNNA